MVVQILLLVAGFILLIKGADILVKGSSSLARRYKISELYIGMTIVAFGTSAPELVVNSIASFEGHGDIVLGNIIGSNNFNLFIIVGIAALINPLIVHRSTTIRELPYSLIAAIVMIILANDRTLFNSGKNVLGRLDGVFLLVFFIFFMIYTIHNLRNNPVTDGITIEKTSIAKMLLLIAGGLTGLIIGGKLVVDAGIDMARIIYVSERVIGLTIIAAGTSLPELATSCVAAYRKNAEIAIGNVVGSNIFNIFLILGISVIISPADFQQSFNKDLVLLISGTVLLILFAYTGNRAKIDRWEAIVLLLIFLSYMLFSL
jgi:cation:H+ antiporter